MRAGLRRPEKRPSGCGAGVNKTSVPTVLRPQSSFNFSKGGQIAARTAFASIIVCVLIRHNAFGNVFCYLGAVR
jgi:hypothetical protein